MNSFSWPGDVITTKDGILITLRDWPGVYGVGKSVFEAMGSTATSLNTAVEQRVNAGREIPTPSDVSPNQIPIPLLPQGQAVLVGYMEEHDRQRLQDQMTMENLARERRSAFLVEFRTSLEPVERVAGREAEGALQHALLGIRTVYLLNGGGLVAIPAILKIISNDPLPGTFLAWAAGVFILGVLFNALANLNGYVAFLSAFEAANLDQHARAKSVEGHYYPPKDMTKHQADVLQHEIDAEKKRKCAYQRSQRGLIAWVLSLISFFVGVILASISVT